MYSGGLHNSQNVEPCTALQSFAGEIEQMHGEEYQP
jgi:hypothetical protein